MRMWNVPPQLLCNKHLLGEHLEMHMFAGAIRKGTSIDGYITGGLVETNRINARHDVLAHEMSRRGMMHVSPLPKVVFKPASGKVNIKKSLRDLAERCVACKDLQKGSRK